MSDLKPCRFCGEKPEMTHHDGSEVVGYNSSCWIKCPTCGATVTEHTAQDSAGWAIEGRDAVIIRATLEWNSGPMENPAHRAGYELARAEAAEAGWQLRAYDVVMRGKG